MFKNITFAQKVNLFVFFQFLLVFALVLSFLAYKEFHERNEQLIRDSIRLVNVGAQQQVATFYRDEATLKKILSEILREPAFAYLAVYDNVGKLIVSQRQAGQKDLQLPNFKFSRNGRSPVELVTTTRDGPAGSKSFTDVSIPIFSFANPSKPDMERKDFGEALVNARNSGSQSIVGYFIVGISQAYLKFELLRYMLLIVLACLVVLLFNMLLTMVLTRRITAPLTYLVKLANNIAEGKVDSSLRAQGTGETRQIASALNYIMSDLNAHRTKMNVSHRLLSMKVDERTEQLSRRSEQLNEAVSEVSETKKSLKQLAYYDGLTSLPNRQLFLEQLDLLLRLAIRHNHILALLFLDLDNFKRINDSLGHNAGDELLKETARRLGDCVRDSDVVAKFDSETSEINVSRLGGDEFTVVLYDIAAPQDAGFVAQRMIDSLQNPMLIEGHEIVITPSIGIALSPNDSNNIGGLLKHADTAMYSAKSGGKNSYCFFTSEMMDAGIARLTLESDLRKALTRNEWEMYYQAQVDAITGQVVGAEGLVRWIHPEKGLVSPAQFIPLAEEMGLIVELGEWTLVESCRQCMEFHRQGLNLPKISVNVSSVQFNTDFVELVGQVLSATGLDPKYLQLELTEGVIMTNARTSVGALHDLKELGVSLSVDDFGTGYSSLSYLSQFPLDELKIDRCFVVDFDKSERNASLISAIIAMGKSLNLRLVAEGVDSAEQFNFLQRNGAETIQGYLFSKPVPGEKFAEMLRHNRFPEQIADMSRGSP